MDPDLLNQIMESRGPEINTVETPLTAGHATKLWDTMI